MCKASLRGNSVLSIDVPTETDQEKLFSSTKGASLKNRHWLQVIPLYRELNAHCAEQTLLEKFSVFLACR